MSATEWGSNQNVAPPMTRESLEAGLKIMREAPIRFEPDMEYWKCKSCHFHGHKIMGVKISCPNCGGEVYDLADALKEVLK